MGCKSSPRPWGCFQKGGRVSENQKVFPTPVGVFLSLTNCSMLHLSLPHARGGVSSTSMTPLLKPGSSPRPWGCFRRACSARAKRKVFPTPVGVFLFPPSTFRAIGCLPHARGGVSHAIQTLPIAARSSPRPWGCFYASRLLYGVAGVFPTPVGVFRLLSVLTARTRCLPHARGGVSLQVKK